MKIQRIAAVNMVIVVLDLSIAPALFGPLGAKVAKAPLLVRHVRASHVRIRRIAVVSGGFAGPARSLVTARPLVCGTPPDVTLQISSHLKKMIG